MRKGVFLLALAGLVSRATPDVLYDQFHGHFVTNPGQGAGGHHASALQTLLNEGVYGYGHQLATGYRVADDFTVTDPVGWFVEQVHFFAYQTGSGTVSTINHVNLRIWDRRPDLAGAVVLFGDTTTNRMISTNWIGHDGKGIYRTTDTSLSATSRPVMHQVVAVGVALPPGTYWLDWQTGGTGTTGPWAPPTTYVGQTHLPGANAMQYTTAWAPLQDVGPDDLPFIVDGYVIPEPGSLLLFGLALLIRRR